MTARHGFWRGEYRYFSYPLPPLIQQLRAMLYMRLSPVAHHWHERMGMDVCFPVLHDEFIARRAAAGETRLSDHSGYRFDAIDPQTKRPWPAMPEVFSHLAQRAARAA